MKHKIWLPIFLVGVLAFFGLTKAQTQDYGEIQPQNPGLDRAQIQIQAISGDEPVQVIVEEVENDAEEILLIADNQAKKQNKKGFGLFAERAEERRSEVANAVQELLEMADDEKGGIGEQVRIIAQNQNQNQEKIEEGLNQIKSRSRFVKFLIGPDFKGLNNAKRILEENREQIRLLGQFKNLFVDESAQQKLTEQVEMLEAINLEIEEKLNESKKGFSLLGWLFKIINK